MGASNPNGVILLKEDEFTTEDEIKVNPLGRPFCWTRHSGRMTLGRRHPAS